MSIEDLVFPEAKIETSGGVITVRGLSLSEVTILVSKHTEAVANLYNHFAKQQAEGKLDDVEISIVGRSLMKSFPSVAAEIIALAAGSTSDKAIKNASKIPLDQQIDVLAKIGEMTFASEGGVKKSLTLVANLLQEATMIFRELTASRNGSGEYAET